MNKCKQNYSGNGRYCISDSVSKSGTSDNFCPGGCRSNSYCDLSSNKCVCDDGFDGDGETCLPVSEISKCGLSCGDHAHCVEGRDDYYCSCDDGFEQNEYGSCVDIDECQTGKLTIS